MCPLVSVGHALGQMDRVMLQLDVLERNVRLGCCEVSV